MQFSTLLPLWLLLACAAASLFVWRRSLVDRPPARRWLAHGLRLLGAVCLILALCRPYWLSTSDHLHVVYLVDVSESVDPESIRTAVKEVEKSSSLSSETFQPKSLRSSNAVSWHESFKQSYSKKVKSSKKDETCRQPICIKICFKATDTLLKECTLPELPKGSTTESK
jgi:hypothetical protein